MVNLDFYSPPDAEARNSTKSAKYRRSTISDAEIQY